MSTLKIASSMRPIISSAPSAHNAEPIGACDADLRSTDACTSRIGDTLTVLSRGFSVCLFGIDGRVSARESVFEDHKVLRELFSLPSGELNSAFFMRNSQTWFLKPNIIFVSCVYDRFFVTAFSPSGCSHDPACRRE